MSKGKAKALADVCSGVRRVRALEEKLREIDGKLCIVKTGTTLEGEPLDGVDMIESVWREINLPARYFGVFFNSTPDYRFTVPPTAQVLATRSLRRERNAVRRAIKGLTGRYPKGTLVARKQPTEEDYDE